MLTHEERRKRVVSSAKRMKKNRVEDAKMSLMYTRPEHRALRDSTFDSLEGDLQLANSTN